MRISVTDRCNLRCRYCMPEEGVCSIPHKEIIRFEEIVEVVRFTIDKGIDKIRLTGGEPLVRKGIVNLVKELALLKGIKDLAMTTNGILLNEFAEPLAQAGLHRINISMDTIDPEKFRYLTRGGDINKVFEGIKAAQKAGLSPLKINCVVEGNSMTKDAEAVFNYCKSNGLEFRYISQMNLSEGIFQVVHGGTGGDCQHCNRLRLTSNGKFKPCLFSDLEYDIRELGIENAFEKALNGKPEKGTKNHNNCFNNIGG
ncbi:MAG: radical SAM protein [Bacteroidales bacterium]|nr:radical SAM protein [Bacteroidales bacterium]